MQAPAIRLNATHAFSQNTFTPFDIALQKAPVLKLVLPLLQRSVDRLTARYHLEKTTLADLFTHPELLDLVFLPKPFQLAGETFGDSYKFVGPSV